MHFGDDGDLMQGTWVHDEMVGKGEYIFADQSKLGTGTSINILINLKKANKK